MDFLLRIFTFGIPIILAITLHEAAHGYVALRYGDDTAQRLGRVSLNPIRHVDLFGTLLLPLFLVAIGTPFVIGYAKPVPLDFSRLRNPHRDTIFVAGAGPATNFLLAIISALLMHFIVFFPAGIEGILKEMLRVSIFINVLLGWFNLIPILPLDGGRILGGLLPQRLAVPFSRLERYGIFLVLAILFAPLLIGINLIRLIIDYPIKYTVDFIAFFTGLS